MFNRKIGFTAVAVFMLLLPVVAFASTSRLEGMNLPGDYTCDYTGIYSWPSCITGVGNLAYGELGNDIPFKGYPVKGWNTYDRAMGAVLPNLWDGRFGVWAIHLREQTPAMGQGDNVSGIGAGNAFDPNVNTNQTIDINWGKKFGNNSLGIQFNRSFNSLVDEIPGTTYTFKQNFAANENSGLGAGNLQRNITGFNVGFGSEMNDKTQVELSLLWQTRTFENSTSPGNKFEDNGGSNYMVGGRIMHKCTGNMTVVPVFKFYNFDLSEKQTVAGTTTSYDNTIKGWQIGAAGNWQIGSNDMFVLGATFAQNTLDQENDVLGMLGTANSYAIGGPFNPKLKATETTYPEIFMSLETQVNPWLTIRMGATKGTWHTVKIEGKTGPIATAVDETITIKDSPFDMNAGCGIKLGSLQFDAVLDNLFFTNPFAQLLGNSEANYWYSEVFPKVSATYRW